jgi:hypothetical protein
MHWYEVQLTSAQVAANEHGRIQSQFEAFFLRLGGPPDMMMLCSRDEDPFRLYFSPATATRAEAILRIAGAVPCERPASTATLLVGEDGAFRRFRAGEF